jgi:hypothetical protein
VAADIVRQGGIRVPGEQCQRFRFHDQYSLISS